MLAIFLVKSKSNWNQSIANGQHKKRMYPGHYDFYIQEERIGGSTEQTLANLLTL